MYHNLGSLLSTHTVQMLCLFVILAYCTNTQYHDCKLLILCFLTDVFFTKPGEETGRCPQYIKAQSLHTASFLLSDPAHFLSFFDTFIMVSIHPNSQNNYTIFQTKLPRHLLVDLHVFWYWLPPTSKAALERGLGSLCAHCCHHCKASSNWDVRLPTRNRECWQYDDMMKIWFKHFQKSMFCLPPK